MDENTPKKNLAIPWMIALIIILVLAVKLVFALLGAVIPQQGPAPSQSAFASQSASPGQAAEPEAPSFCVHCGKALPAGFQWGQYCPYCGTENQLLTT